MREPIKTSYDRTILTMAAEGAISCEIIAATGKTRNQIYNRAAHLGVWPALVANRRDRRVARNAERGACSTAAYANGRSALALAAIPPARIDRTASDLARTLRAAGRHVPSCVPVPASVIAHVFQAGLTLDDIDAAYSIPPAEAVAAIRQHLGEHRA